jgi:membrane fusion protein (multidrug efflux system)
MHPCFSRLVSASLAALLLSACGGGAQEDKPAAAGGDMPGTPVTARAVERSTVYEREVALGTVHAKQAPTIGAEVAARVTKIHADEGQAVREGELLAELDAGDFRLARDRSLAEIARLEALIENQRRQVERNQHMLERKLIAQSVVDNAEAELRALQSQLEGERSALAQTERNIERTRVVAPLAGRLESRLINVGDWVSVGTPLFRIATDHVLRAQIPFPEYVAELLRPGLPLELSSPAVPDQTVEGVIAEIRPMIGAARAITVIAEFTNPGGWRPGASVNASVTLAKREGALLVPAVSVVQRPGGKVVYVVAGDKVEARPVRTGIRQKGMVEIVEGLSGDEVVVVDGAGFLTDGARINVRAELAPQ